MPIEIRMPALSPTMTEGNLARWLKKEGDQVAPGDVIAEIETDKATMEVEAVEEGTLGKILVPDGTEGVAVNAPIALLLEEGEDAAALEELQAGGRQAPPAAPSRSRPSPARAGSRRTARPKSRRRPPPRSRRRVRARAATAPSAASGSSRARSPSAWPSRPGIDLGRLEGSGPHGRIIKVDIERAIQAGVPEKARPAAEAARPPRSRGPRKRRAPRRRPHRARPPSRTRRSSSPTCAR